MTKAGAARQSERERMQWLARTDKNNNISCSRQIAPCNNSTLGVVARSQYEFGLTYHAFLLVFVH